MSDNTEAATPRFYSNFSNPVGLAFRIVKSGNSIAYQTLAREIARPLLWPVDRLMQSKETRLLAEAKEVKLPIVLIVGSPRSGSTLLYLALSQALNVSWIPNVSQMFPRSPITAARLFGQRKKKVPYRLASFFGNTSGLSLPSDAFSVWNRWYGEDRYLPRVSDDSIGAMRQFMATWIDNFEKPLLNKNNRNSLCVKQLSEIFPTAHFVVINRNHADIARSLVRSREFVQGSKFKPWGLLSHSNHKDDELGYIEDVCDQIAKIGDEIQTQVSAVDSSRITHVSYEDLCSEPVSLVNSIALRSGVSISENGIQVLSTIKKSSSRLLSTEEEQRLGECLEQFGLDRL